MTDISPRHGKHLHGDKYNFDDSIILICLSSVCVFFLVIGNCTALCLTFSLVAILLFEKKKLEEELEAFYI